jgi:hypothetical protein
LLTKRQEQGLDNQLDQLGTTYDVELGRLGNQTAQTTHYVTVAIFVFPGGNEVGLHHLTGQINGMLSDFLAVVLAKSHETKGGCV